jgi:glycosyltransferase involved in cell wall biosynthesis
MPHVSVIMLSYNYSRYISEAIDSVLGQSHSDYELIIIDDGSTDGSDDLGLNFLNWNGLEDTMECLESLYNYCH